MIIRFTKNCETFKKTEYFTLISMLYIYMCVCVYLCFIVYIYSDLTNYWEHILYYIYCYILKGKYSSNHIYYEILSCKYWYIYYITYSSNFIEFFWVFFKFWSIWYTISRNSWKSITCLIFRNIFPGLILMVLG